MLFRPFSIESHGGGGSHGAAVVHVLHTDRTSFSYIFSERLRQPLTVLELAGLLVLFFTPFFVFFCPCACLVGLATCSGTVAKPERLAAAAGKPLEWRSSSFCRSFEGTFNQPRASCTEGTMFPERRMGKQCIGHSS